jgi:hypothetical protein
LQIISSGDPPPKAGKPLRDDVASAVEEEEEDTARLEELLFQYEDEEDPDDGITRALLVDGEEKASTELEVNGALERKTEQELANNSTVATAPLRLRNENCCRVVLDC